MALRENRVWGVKERLYERMLPQASDAQLARLLQSAHVVDGIVKGLKASRLATGRLAGAVAPGAAAVPPGARSRCPAPCGPCLSTAVSHR
jgi:hypothetical protein